MPSMSYCKFENTLADLEQCVEAMESAPTFESLHLGSYEYDAFEELYSICQTYVYEYQRLNSGKNDV